MVRVSGSFYWESPYRKLVVETKALAMLSLINMYNESVDARMGLEHHGLLFPLMIFLNRMVFS